MGSWCLSPKGLHKQTGRDSWVPSSTNECDPVKGGHVTQQAMEPSRGTYVLLLPVLDVTVICKHLPGLGAPPCPTLGPAVFC